MWKFAVRNLLSRPARSALSLLGLTVAIAGMVGLFSVAKGIDATVEQTFGQIPGLLVMQTGAPIPLFSRLPLVWGDEIQQLDGVGVVTPEVLLRVNIINGKNVISPPRFFLGIDIASRLKLKKGIYLDAMKEGRFLGSEDLGKKHVVVSRAIAQQFEKKLGDTMRINGADMTIVGIYHCGSLLLDVAILVDVGTLRQQGWVDRDSACSFYVEPNGRVPIEVLSKKISEHFRGRSLVSNTTNSLWSLLALASPTTPSDSKPTNPISSLFGLINPQLKSADKEKTSGTDASSMTEPDKENALPIEVRSSSDWAEKVGEFSQDLDLFLALMTGIGMTIAVLSIINTMLMSVSERVIEFGILKANGWTPWDVLRLVTFESATLGLGGGLLGSFIGWLVTQVFNARWPERLNLYASPGLLVFSITFSTLIGMLGGLYPALWAMRLSPMEAIRRG
ncbi:MAG: ABC transporter permease [Planctomycetia bacterium]|nr:ABC transporter permease [Planctomycetia bacterium]